MLRFALVFLILTPAFFGFASARASTCLTLSISPNPAFLVLANHFTEAMKKRGHCFVIQHFPPKRATAQLRAGKIDGELFRTADYQDVFGKDAVMVPEFLVRAGGMLTSLRTPNRNLDMFQGETIAYLSGSKWATDAATGHENLFAVDRGHLGLDMVRKERVAAMFIDSVSWNILAPRYPELKSILFQDLTGYMFLSPKHADKVPAIAAAIKDHRDKDGGLMQVLRSFTYKN